MKSTMRRYQTDKDYWRIRSFLREIFLKNNREQVSWEVARFDYWRWHGILNMKDGTLEDDVFIWETETGKITAVLNREAPGCAYLQLHPDFQTTELEMEMLSIAEQHLSVPGNDNHRKLHIWAEQKDTHLQQVLNNRGYTINNNNYTDHQRVRLLSELIHPSVPADGFVVRPLGDIDEHQARCWLSWHTFHPKEPKENFVDGGYPNLQRGPLYRRDLDLVAIAPDGELAAFCTIWFDDFTRTGYFEPVGTSPHYQQKGLGKAIMNEGLRRLKNMGADLAFVASGSDPAHALYASVGFQTYRIMEPWTKFCPPLS